MIAVHVAGGTGAGRKRPPKERRWRHDCIKSWPSGLGDLWASWTTLDRELTAYSCPDCGARRPTTTEDK